MKRVIVSDIHIGSSKYNYKDLVDLLKNTEYDQLILAGDIIDFIKIPSFSHRFIEILNAIDFSKDIVYVVGNHDVSFEGLVGYSAFKVGFVKEYEFEEAGRKFRVVHGHQFDNGLVRFDFLMKFVSIIHDWIERTFTRDLTTWWVNYKIRKRKLRRVWDILKLNTDVDVIIMGHCHYPEAVIWVDKDQSIKTYVNSGDWVSHKSWVSIIDGVVRLRSQNS